MSVFYRLVGIRYLPFTDQTLFTAIHKELTTAINSLQNQLLSQQEVILSHLLTAAN